MTMLLDSISCDIESDMLSTGRLPRQFTYTRLVNGSASICRDLSYIGYDGLSLTHTGDIIRHRPLIINRSTGLIHANNVQHSIEESGLDFVTVNTFNRQFQLFTVELLLEVFYGLTFVNVDTMNEYLLDSNDVTSYDLIVDDVLKCVPVTDHCRYAEYFITYIPGV
jgi:hypothetical protein